MSFALKTFLLKITGGLLKRQHAHYMSAALASQVILLLTAPILTRIYTPTEFGAYAAYYSLMSLIGPLAPLAYDQAIQAEETEQGALQVVALCLSISFVIATLVALGLLMLFEVGILPSYMQAIATLLPWLPFSILLVAVYNVLHAWQVRKGRFSLLATNRLVLAGLTSGLQLAVGWLGMGPLGLVIANLLGFLAATFSVVRTLPADGALRKLFFDASNLKAMARRQLRFPKYTFPASILNSVSQQLPDLLIFSQFGSQALGFYSLANRVTTAPISFLSSSMSVFFRNAAADDFRAAQNCTQSFHNYLKLFTAIAGAILVALFAVAPGLVPIIFGEQWSETGIMVRILAPLVAIRFVAGSLNYVWLLSGRNHLDAVWQLGLLGITFLSLAYGDELLGWPGVQGVLLAYCIGATAWYSVNLFLTWRFSK